nr:hypothetical protein HK105_004577 [Polyrhizophydium stewartii]
MQDTRLGGPTGPRRRREPAGDAAQGPEAAAGAQRPAVAHTGQHRAHAAAQPTQQRATLAKSLQLIASYFWTGLKDSSTTLKTRIAQCLFLNGVIFLGSVLLFDHAVSPLARAALELLCRSLNISDDTEAVIRRLGSLVSGLYYAAWIYPLYVFSFFASSKWYQDIANRSYQIFVGEPQTQQTSLPKQVSPVNTVIAAATAELLKGAISDAYRGLLVLNYLVQASLVRHIPVVGPLLSFVLLDFLFAFFAFEYKWINRKWPLSQQLDFFESHWAYFAGFGLPMTLLTFFFPQAVNLGLFALVFPIFIIMANHGRPVPTRKDPIKPSYLPAILPVFYVAQKTNLVFIGLIKWRRDALAAAASANQAVVTAESPEISASPSTPETPISGVHNGTQKPAG